MVFVKVAQLDRLQMLIKEHVLVDKLNKYNADAHNIEIIITVVKNVHSTKFLPLQVPDVKTLKLANKITFLVPDKTAIDVSTKLHKSKDQLAHAINLSTLPINAKIAQMDKLLIQELVNASKLKDANKTTFKEPDKTATDVSTKLHKS